MQEQKFTRELQTIRDSIIKALTVRPDDNQAINLGQQDNEDGVVDDVSA